MPQTTTFTPAQCEVINLMSCITSSEDIQSLKDVLVKFLNSRLQNELNRLWDNGSLTDEKMETLSHQHLRTAYK